MESKRKKRKVRKVGSATRELPKSPKQPDKNETKPSAESLIRRNGDLIEQLIKSEAWTEIAFPLLQESIAGVSGRFTNGRFHHGTLTSTPSINAGLPWYQKALMDFYNHLQDFIVERDRLITEKKKEEQERSLPIYNPYLEDFDERD